MKNLILGLLLVGSMMSCSSPEDKIPEGAIIISGTVTNPGQGLITLEKMTRFGSEPIDTIILDNNNQYRIYFTDEPGFYRMNFFNQQASIVIIDQDDLTIDYINGTVKATGSRELKMLEEFQKTVNDKFGPRELAINKAFTDANQAGDAAGVNKAREDYMALMKEKQEFSANLIKNYDVNLGTYQLVRGLDKDSHLELIDSLAKVLNEKYPGRFYIEDLVASVDKARATAIGAQAPEISLPNPDGEIVNLSSLRGQVVLVDFWAQWCRPCRMENPNVVKAYQKYKDKGFTVYGVSLDRTKDKWLQAIEEDNLTWTHVSDLKYFQSVAAQTYGIESIPFSILLDREGKIIAKNLRGQALEKELEKFFAAEAGS